MPDIDPDLKALVQAQLDANRIAQSELNIKRRMEAAQLESISSTEALKQDVRQLLHELRRSIRSANKQLRRIHQQNALQDDALRDFFENLSYRVERIDQGLSLLLISRLESQQARDQAQGIVLEISEEHKRRLRLMHLKNLQYLQQQAAAYGVVNVPLDLVNKINAEKEYLEGLR